MFSNSVILAKIDKIALSTVTVGNVQINKLGREFMYTQYAVRIRRRIRVEMTPCVRVLTACTSSSALNRKVFNFYVFGQTRTI